MSDYDPNKISEKFNQISNKINPSVSFELETVQKMKVLRDELKTPIIRISTDSVNIEPIISNKSLEDNNMKQDKFIKFQNKLSEFKHKFKGIKWLPSADSIEKALRSKWTPPAMACVAVVLMFAIILPLMLGAPGSGGVLTSDSSLSSSDPVPVGDFIPEDAIYVNTREEFFAAIGSDRTIVLNNDRIILYDYGMTEDELNQYAEENKEPDGNVYSHGLMQVTPAGTGNDNICWDAFPMELAIKNVNNLTIRGGIGTQALLRTADSYAWVLKFENCTGITVKNIQAGHMFKGYCAGGVLKFTNCTDINIDNAGLYGCGVEGIGIFYSENVNVINSDIYECSADLIHIYDSKNVNFINTKLRDTGDSQLVNIGSSQVIFDGCVFENNSTWNDGIWGQSFFGFTINYDGNNNGWSNESVIIKNSSFTGNKVILLDNTESFVFENCTFSGNKFESNGALDENGIWRLNDKSYLWQEPNYKDPIIGDPDSDAADETFEYSGYSKEPANWEAPKVDEVSPGIFKVYNAAGFIQSIGSDRTIIVANDFILNGDQIHTDNWDSTVNVPVLPDYGNKNASWEQTFDGYQLNISDVWNLIIKGDGTDRKSISIAPRYAAVLYFKGCDNINLDNLSLGHIDGLGSCMGGVVSLYSCSNINIISSGLFGCGTYGIEAVTTKNVNVKSSEIYHCTYGLLNVGNTCENFTFTDTIFRDSTGYASILAKNTLFERCIFTGNGKSMEGGLGQGSSLIDGLDVKVKNCMFKDNTTTYLTSSLGVTFDNCKFDNNNFDRNGKLDDKGIWTPNK